MNSGQTSTEHENYEFEILILNFSGHELKKQNVVKKVKHIQNSLQVTNICVYNVAITSLKNAMKGCYLIINIIKKVYKHDIRKKNDQLLTKFLVRSFYIFLKFLLIR